LIGFYITHPQVAADASVPVPEWGLSEIGRSRLVAIRQRPWVRSLSRIVASAERKAVEGAAILAETAAVEYEIAPETGENDRSATGYLPPPEFEKAADWFFANPERSFRGWERAIDAQARIVRAVGALLDGGPNDRPIAFVGHGGVGTLLKCHLAGMPISRSGDQPPGGGNIFAFRLSDRRLLCHWTPVETFTGELG
jgi:broad specificity phosphatase PhoE